MEAYKGQVFLNDSIHDGDAFIIVFEVLELLIQKPDNPLKGIRNQIIWNPDNSLKGIRDLVQNRTRSQWPRGLTVPS